MFKKSLSFFLILFLFAAKTATAQQNCSTHEDILVQLLHDFLAGASVNDYDMHDRFWADDLIYTGSNGERIFKSDIMSGLSRGAAQLPDEPLTIYTAEDVQVKIYEHAAVVAFRLVAEIPLESGEIDILNFYNTGTFILRDGKWRAVAWQATRTEVQNTSNF